MANLGSLYARITDSSVQAKNGRVYSHKVQARDEGRKLIKVEVYSANGVALGGQHVRQGTGEVVVFDSEMPEVLAQVASEEHKRDWKEAERVYMSTLARYLDNAVGKPPSHDRAQWPQDYTAKRERAEKMFGATTPSLEFCRRHPHGRPPLASCEVLEDLPAPITDANRDATRLEGLISRLVEGLGARVAQGARAR